MQTIKTLTEDAFKRRFGRSMTSPLGLLGETRPQTPREMAYVASLLLAKAQAGDDICKGAEDKKVLMQLLSGVATFAADYQDTKAVWMR